MLLRGVGIGIIVTATVFYGVILFTGIKNVEEIKNEYKITNEEIIERASKLGMVFITELQNEEGNNLNGDVDSER